MRYLFLLALGLLLFARCGSTSNSQKEQAITKVEIDDPVETEIYTDTVRDFTDVLEFEFNGPSSSDKTIFIEGAEYRLHLECELLKDQRIKEVDKSIHKGKLYLSTIVGYQARYRFALYQGEKLLFDRTLKKEDLKESCYPLVLQSDAFLPEFVTYNTAFKSLVFHVPISLQESCWSANALVVIDMNGNVKFVDELSEGGGNHSNREVQFSPSDKHMISASIIHHANGKKVKLDTKASGILGVDILGECLFVVYDHDAEKHPQNAYLIDYEGKTLLNFHYKHVGDGLGYHFPRVVADGHHYFFDEENKRLIKLQKGKKWSYQFLAFSEMQEFDGVQRSSEIPLFFQTDMYSYQFYLDTGTSKLRKITPEEFY